MPTCGQEAVCSKHQLGGDLHLAVPVVLERREVPLVLVGIHLLPVLVVSWAGEEDQIRVVIKTMFTCVSY